MILINSDLIDNSGLVDISKMAFIQEGSIYDGIISNISGTGIPESQWKEVYLDSYFIDKYEVTIGEYTQFQNESGYPTPEDHSLFYKLLAKTYDHRYPENLDDYPINRVLHTMMLLLMQNGMVKEFLQKLNGKKRREAALSMARYSWGDDPPTAENHEKIRATLIFIVRLIVPRNQDLKYLPVGMSDPNNFGLYDITGNAGMEAVYTNTRNSSGKLLITPIKGASWMQVEYGMCRQ